MSMTYDDIIREQVEAPPKKKYWHELVKAMMTSMQKLRSIANQRAERAAAKAEALKKEIKKQKKAIKKQKRYGTHTGIFIKKS